MKKNITLLCAALLLLAATACSSEPVALDDVQQEATLVPSVVEASKTSDIPKAAEQSETESEAQQTGTYTIGQIQSALETQLKIGSLGEGNPQVISAEEVERDRDSITLGEGSDAPTVDLTNAARYKVEIRYSESLDDYNVWAEIYKDAEENPFRRDGDFTIMTEYYYFFDADGEPVLAFIRD